jgi:Protein of unknown function (DUF2946)
MDDIVQQAMSKWPNVPAAFGWLRLSSRGHWYLIDRGAPDFDTSAPALGSKIHHAALIDFIARNYQSDGAGQWYFQNGPQRVFVNLDTAPLVLRVFEERSANTIKLKLFSHTGLPITQVDHAFTDSSGQLYMHTNLGPACVQDLDLANFDFEHADLNQHAKAHLTTVRLGEESWPLETIADPETTMHFSRQPTLKPV